MTGKQGLMTIGFKLFAFLFLWGGVKLYRTIFPTMDGSMRMSDAYRSWPLLERSRDLLGVPFLELAKRSGMADEDATEDIDVKPLFAQLQQDWFAIENVSTSHGATHRAVARLMGCIWQKAQPCSNEDGKSWKRVSVDLRRDRGCDYKGSVSLSVSCARSGTSKPDLLWPGNRTLSHDLQWTVIGNGAVACFSGTPTTGTLRYINLLGFYGSRESGKCGRTDPTAILQILGVLPPDNGHVLTPEEVLHAQTLIDKEKQHFSNKAEL
jgi:hypothetical protein